MPAGVSVHVTDTAIIRACNTPGGPVSNWRDQTMLMLVDRCYARSPVNNPLNAQHRGGKVGTFKIGWRNSRYGNQHVVGLRVTNVAPHAVYVEEGRRAAPTYQRFSWTKWGGEIGTVHGTGPRAGKHILARSTAAVVAAQT